MCMCLKIYEFMSVCFCIVHNPSGKLCVYLHCIYTEYKWVYLCFYHIAATTQCVTLCLILSKVHVYVLLVCTHNFESITALKPRSPANKLSAGVQIKNCSCSFNYITIPFCHRDAFEPRWQNMAEKSKKTYHYSNLGAFTHGRPTTASLVVTPDESEQVEPHTHQECIVPL